MLHGITKIAQNSGEFSQTSRIGLKKEERIAKVGLLESLLLPTHKAGTRQNTTE